MTDQKPIPATDEEIAALFEVQWCETCDLLKARIDAEKEKAAALEEERDGARKLSERLWRRSQDFAAEQNKLQARINKLNERVAELEADRDARNRLKTTPPLGTVKEMAEYVMAHSDEFVTLAVDLARCALELDQKVSELHAGFGRSEAAEMVHLRKKVAALETLPISRAAKLMNEENAKLHAENANLRALNAEMLACTQVLAELPMTGCCPYCRGVDHYAGCAVLVAKEIAAMAKAQK